MNTCFIMVRPGVPGNVGASARAIKTMGFSELRLVNPCNHLGDEARKLAHGSHDILEGALVFSSLKDALGGIDFSIASTAKSRKARIDYYRNTELLALIRAKGKTIGRIAVVFGCEESGLSNEEIQLCDIASSITLKQPYPSLNLSQAVMLYAYTLADLPQLEIPPKKGKDERKDFGIMMYKSKEILRKLEVDGSPALYNRILERIALLGEDDIHLLLSVLGRLE